MIPQKQKYIGQEDVHGDCHRTCLAMVLDMDRDDVPHFMEGVSPNLPFDHPENLAAEQRERDWLAARGLSPVYIPFSGQMSLFDICEQLKVAARGSAVILGCAGRSGNHSVVIHEGVVHDPGTGGIMGPMLDGMWWVTILSHATKPLQERSPGASVAGKESKSDGN